MKKIIVTFLFLLFTFNWVCAQNKVSSSKNFFSLGLELLLPVGLFGEVYAFGLGASGQGNFSISHNTTLTLYTGYINYLLKKTYGTGNQGYIPVLGGIEVGFSHAVYGSAQLGSTFRTGLGGAFTYSPGIGYRLNRNFTVLIKYVGQTKSAINSSAIGVRAAYIFGK